MKKNAFLTLLVMLTIVAMTCTAVSCNGNGKKSDTVELNEDGDDDEVAEADDAITDVDSSADMSEASDNGGVALTFENMAGVYESLDDDFNSESRLVLNADGTATWNMIGSLTVSNYTYTINGNTICLTLVDLDDDEEDCYEYSEDERALKNANGEVFYRQVED